MRAILDYITNNVSANYGANIKPTVEETVILPVSIQDTIETELGTANCGFRGFLTDKNTLNILIYGWYNTGTPKGFVCILNKDLEVLQTITKNSNGYDLFNIRDMKQDINGNVYAISTDNDIIRILLLNNIFVKSGSYKVNIRASYIIPNSSSYKMTTYSLDFGKKLKLITKAQDEATYFTVLKDKSTEENVIIRFTINVGSDNEWEVIRTGIESSGFDYLTEKSGDKYLLHYYCNNVGSNQRYYAFSYENTDLIEAKTIDTDIRIDTCYAISPNEVYITGVGQTDNYVKKVDRNTTKNLFTFDLGEELTIETIENVVYIKHLTSNYAKIMIIQKEIITWVYDIPATISMNYSPEVFASKNYNLLNIYVQRGSGEQTQRLTFDYNDANYNGFAYDNYNELVPRKARIYLDSELGFARNLYNNVINGETTISTVQIPNSLLNSGEIDQQMLLGETNKELLVKAQIIEKNVYETLYINFIRTLTVKDTDTNTTYPESASYINQNINIGTKQNCESSFIGKVRVNDIVQSITWNWNSNHYETEFSVNSTGTPVRIEFISNDETTIYLSKELDLASGNYKVSQKLKIQ